jgi:hypothetical protein
MQELAAERGWRWTVELAVDPDRELSVSTAIVATADSVILDRCARWCNLACDVLSERVPQANIVRLGTE